MPKLTLYGTLGCHLCDDAEAWLKHAFGSLDYQKVDIAEQESLVEQYGVRIPVLSTGEQEFDWPFQYEMLAGAIAQLSCHPAADNLASHIDASPVSKTNKHRRVLELGASKK